MLTPSTPGDRSATPASTPGNGTSQPLRLEHDGVEAFTVCQQFVQDRLRAPATADFPSGTYRYTTHLGDGAYRVTAYVDSQNAFGANVRTDYRCEVQWVAGDRWRLVNLQMETR